jgi:hypothetical protein
MACNRDIFTYLLLLTPFIRYNTKPALLPNDNFTHLKAEPNDKQPMICACLKRLKCPPQRSDIKLQEVPYIGAFKRTARTPPWTVISSQWFVLSKSQVPISDRRPDLLRQDDSVIQWICKFLSIAHKIRNLQPRLLFPHTPQFVTHLSSHLSPLFRVSDWTRI